KEPTGPGYYATPWQVYADKSGITFKPILVNQDLYPTLTLAIPQMLRFIHLPGDFTAEKSENSCFRVGAKDSGFYTTPWDEFTSRNGFNFEIAILETLCHDRPNLTELVMNHVSPTSFTLGLPDLF